MHKQETDYVWIESYICPKVTEMGSLISHRSNYNGVGVLRGQWYIPNKNWPN